MCKRLLSVPCRDMKIKEWGIMENTVKIVACFLVLWGMEWCCSEGVHADASKSVGSYFEEISEEELLEELSFPPLYLSPEDEANGITREDQDWEPYPGTGPDDQLNDSYKNNPAMSGWRFIDNRWYYTDAQGVLQTGWVLVAGQWYYFNDSVCYKRVGYH